MATDRTYDAIIVGGGHNGLVNGAYLAKAGLKTLVIERRHLVGGAAITEELYPGFSFTTFSYALSLLRPDIIHELELVKYGFKPLLMESTFAPMDKTTRQISLRSGVIPSTMPTPTTSIRTTSIGFAGRSNPSSTIFLPTSPAGIRKNSSGWRHWRNTCATSSHAYFTTQFAC